MTGGLISAIGWTRSGATDADAIGDAVSATGRALRTAYTGQRQPGGELGTGGRQGGWGALAPRIAVALIGPVAKWHRQASPSSSPTDFTEIR
jgi:hypothetical protein